MYPIIIAGGQGTRLWPVSRRKNPKQIKPFLGEKTLLNKTYERVSNIAPRENIFLATTKDLLEDAKREVPGISSDNILAEPAPRGTAAALGLALFKLYTKDKDSTFVYINADNFVKDEEEYKRILELGENIIAEHSDKVLLVGVKPAYAEEGYGYIKLGDELKNYNEDKLYSIKTFIEKPDKETAEGFLKEGGYLWNPTLIISKTEHFLSLYKKHLPEMYEKLREIARCWGTPHEEDALEEIFSTISPVSIDYGILEHEENMFAMPADFGWMDIGHWKAIFEMLCNSQEDNVELGRHVHVDSKGNLIYSESGKLMATAGVENMVIVETGDAVMVCPKNKAQDVKKIVQKLEEQNEEEYL